MAEATASVCDGGNMMETQLEQFPEVSIPGQRRNSVGSSQRSGEVIVRNEQRAQKRGRDEVEEDRWLEINRNGKRVSRRGSMAGGAAEEERIEAYITSGTELPKQFAFALFLKNNMIANVSRIKFITPFKILIEFENQVSLEKLINCEDVAKKGWRVSRTLEVQSSYGIIKKVELELKEEDILKGIQCEAKLLAVKRLTRRSDDGTGWTASECVRLCFKGSSLPPHVYVHGIRVKVESYTFPVTQCSFCWAFGHPRKMCPRKRVVCPKCGKHHENCESTSYKCINCTGNHLALSKKCPVYIKERKIRSIMSDFNCTYRKALIMYVPETSHVVPDFSNEFPALPRSKSRTPSRLGPSAEDQECRPDTPMFEFTSTFASAAGNTNQTHNFEKTPSGPKQNKLESVKNKKNNKNQTKKNTHNQSINNIFTHDWDCYCSDSECGPGPENKINQTNTRERRQRRSLEREERDSFENILEKLKNIFLSKEVNL